MYASVQNRKLAEIFFSRDGMAPEENCLILRILENAILSEKNKQTNKKATIVFYKVYRENTWKYMKLKYLDRLQKKTSIVSSWSRSHSPIDNCSLFIRHKEYVASNYCSYKCWLCSHSQQQSRCQYGFFSRSAKPAGAFQQLHNKLCMSFWMAT